MRINFLTALALGIAATGASVVSAKADPVSMFFGVSGSSIPANNTVFAYNSGAGSAGFLSTTDIPLSLTIQGSATGSPIIPQPQIQSNTVDIKTDHGVTLYVWVLETGITAPLGVYNMLSGFTSNILINASVVESTYVSTANNDFGTIVVGTTPTPTTFAGTLLASQSFSANGTVTDIDATPNFTGPYSEVQEYQITFNTGGGEVNATISTQYVPEPASLALLGVGMIGVGAVSRKRRAAV
jgi:hypothetical protein